MAICPVLVHCKFMIRLHYYIMLKRFKFIIFAAVLAACFFATDVSADIIGDKKTFYTNTGYDRLGRSSVGATLRAVSDKAYFYVEDRYWDNLNFIQAQTFTNKLKDLATDLDTAIYPNETKFWGSEPNPGVDGDPRLTIFLEDLQTNYGGYFETINVNPDASPEESNHREMFVASTNALGGPFLKSFLAHEFQHLISYNQKELLNNSTEDVWLNEGRSEYSITLNGYNDFYTGSNLESRVKQFQDTPSDSLTEWPNVKADYAIADIFTEYLADRFGPNILSETLHYKSYGIPSLEEYLKARGMSFEDVFMDWMAAVYLNNRALDSKFGYIKGGLNNIKIQPQYSVRLYSTLSEYNNSVSIKDWQPYWFEYDLNGLTDRSKSLQLDIDKQMGQNFLVSYIAFYNNGQIEVNKISLVTGNTQAYITNSQDKQLSKVIVMITNGTKLIDFGKSEPLSVINIKSKMTDNSYIEAQTLKDGSLIKRPREKEIYVIWGKYKRYLNPEVIKLYGHLDPSKAIEVGPEIFDSYRSSNYVRYVNDERVYAVWPDGTKHWLHITPQQWDASARDWNSIFIINELELGAYKTGPDITR